MTDHDPRQLVDTRLQLHWAAQLLASSADALVDHAADDSHSNVGWDSDRSTMVARSGVELAVPTLTLSAPGGAARELAGGTLADARAWLGGELGVQLAQRDYEMPEHDVATSAAFEPDFAALKAIAEWFSFGQERMQPFAESRIWPHHLDLGWLIEIDGPSRSIGGGLSPGDAGIAEPYFYVNPYGVEKPDSLPELPAGDWTDAWFGAVLTASQISSASEPADFAQRFLDEAVAYCKDLVERG